MIVNQGLVTKLNSERTYLATLIWHLFTNNHTVAASDTTGSYTEAAWTGYASVTSLTWGVPTIVGAVALSTGSPNPSFGNSSGSSQTFYGWYATDPGGQLVAAVNIGLTTITNGGAYVITPSTTLAEA